MLHIASAASQDLGPSGSKGIVDTDSGHVCRFIMIHPLLGFPMSFPDVQSTDSSTEETGIQNTLSVFNDAPWRCWCSKKNDLYEKDPNRHQLYMFVDLFPCRHVDEFRDMLYVQSICGISCSTVAR